MISSFRCRVSWVNFCKLTKKKIIIFLYILNQTGYIKKSFAVRVFVPTCVTVHRGELPSVQQSHVAIAQLRHPVNLGRTLEETHLVVLVLAPSKAVSIGSSGLVNTRTELWVLKQGLIHTETSKQKRLADYGGHCHFLTGLCSRITQVPQETTSICL